MDPKGHAAIVTGGASGLGAETATALAQAGAKVALLDVNVDGARGSWRARSAASPSAATSPAPTTPPRR